MSVPNGSHGVLVSGGVVRPQRAIPDWPGLGRRRRAIWRPKRPRSAARMAGLQCVVKTVTPGDGGALDMQKKWPAGRRADEDAPGRRCVIAVLAFCAGAVSAGQIDL